MNFENPIISFIFIFFSSSNFFFVIQMGNPNLTYQSLFSFPIQPPGLQKTPRAQPTAHPQRPQNRHPLPPSRRHPRHPHPLPAIPNRAMSPLGHRRTHRRRLQRLLRPGGRPRRVQRLHQQLLRRHGTGQTGSETQIRSRRFLQSQTD